MNSSLHPLEERAEEEEVEDNSGSHCNPPHRGDGAVTVARPHTPLDDANATANNNINGRKRSDSLTTGGGLHYPLGEKSPILQRRVRSLSLTSTPSLFQQSGNTMDGRDNVVALMPLPFVEADEECDDGISENNGDAPFLKRRQPHNNSNSTAATTTLTRYPRPNNTTSTIKSTAEINAIYKWQQEISQQEKSHLEERNQNVKLLLDRRKRSQDRLMRSRQQQQQQQLSNHADHDTATVMVSNNEDNRSGSPVALATATSASSSSERSCEESHNDDGSGSSSAMMSRSRSSSPVSRRSTTATNATPRTITVTPSIIKGEKEQENPINRYMNSLELEMSHRSWYQQNGRLVVFHSLPYMSPCGKVVVHPLLFEKEDVVTMDDEEEQQQQQEKGCGEEEDEVITLAPGTTVMAEEAITLDSHSLTIIQSTGSTSKQFQHEHTDYSTTLVLLRISSPYPGYILSHIHNYPYLAPGPPTTYTNSTWLWRVTCQPDGAFIRSGLDLVTDHIGTLPYGTLCCVKKKVVNYMGLNRLEIDAFVSNSDSGGGGSNDEKAPSSSSTDTTNKLSGYISEFLNPLSGQRGNIVEQVPFPVPALYKVIHAEGVIIRSGVELSTRQIGFAPVGSILSIVGRSYSSNPSNNCIERLRLAGGGGWISVTLNRGDNDHLVEMIGVDETFDPEDPASFHFEQQKRVMAELKADDKESSSSINNNFSRLPSRRSTANLSEIGEDDQLSIPDTNSVTNNDSRANNNNAFSTTPPRPKSTAAAAVPTLFQRSGVVGTLGGLAVMDAVRESSSDKHQNDNANRCLICLSDERTATIVHGETGHIACCLTCARILKARGDNCPVCRLPIDLVIQQFWA